jgi:uncharacterized protein (TIGR02217 family)
MSDYVYPVLDGLTFDVEKTPDFATIVQRSIGGNETRASYYYTSIKNWVLPYSFLDITDYGIMVAFFEARKGAFENFLFSDTSENQAVLFVIGYGTGSEQHFQIDRMAEGTAYATNAYMPAPQIYLDGVLQSSGYSLSAADLITFTTPPANGVVISWSGNLYHRVKFVTDIIDLNEFMWQLWELKQVNLVSVR